MSEFSLFFGLGLEHILDVNGYDHILFVIALCAIYSAQQWKNVLVLVTAFTLGHSLTLALSTLDIIKVDSGLVEFLIPITIFVTAAANIYKKDAEVSNESVKLNYWFAAFFGLIHGMGFSNYLKSLLGKDESIVTQLLAFNLGLEVGQIVIVLAVMVAAFLFMSLGSIKKRDWILVISSAVAGISLTMIIESKFW
ncbi:MULTISPECIES: HupE/UreJ family protein [unclassified Imperialibacter]|uniref:HupE/UreJ family protein n=1 Tax=unclassified Imperialibacter TaxID=2629706 RepID=UPI0012517E93|nr:MULTISPECIES: HupE/UreJ family protein [unclassified Imperialibacter]CAD5269195.1 HupE / UreJ protein [Imperialibacter sp. 89]CAD5297433.1 HupE / UreJ protein [Imperialibacter sp. 75]VVT34112.1 HupE / UreJ protein [Imperialibacter sp. EC-SDR9]